jgi:hypothetical protein
MLEFVTSFSCVSFMSLAFDLLLTTGVRRGGGIGFKGFNLILVLGRTELQGLKPLSSAGSNVAVKTATYTAKTGAVGKSASRLGVG